MKGVEGGEDKTGQHFPPLLGAQALTPPLPPCQQLVPWTAVVHT